MKVINKLTLNIFSLLSGALLPFAFAPFHWYPLAFISPAVLLFIWLRSTPWQALYRGFLFGIGLFGVGASWVYISIHTFGNASTALAGLITALFVLILAVFPATQGLFFTILFRRSRTPLTCLLAFPAVWILWECLRTWIFSGFPWLFLGYSQLDSLLRGFTPLFGVYGLSLITTVISGSLALLIVYKNCKFKVASLCLIILLFGIGAALSTAKWTHPSGKTVSASLVQGNISQTLKWNNAALLNILKIYRDETNQHWNSKIIVWPEAAIPAFPQQVQFYIDLMQKEAQQHGVALILGVPTLNSKTQEYHNSMIVLGNGKGLYSKRKLVPFGEYIPLKNIFSGIMKKFNIPMSGFTPGAANQPPMIAAGIPFSPFICYEIAYPVEIIDSVKNTQLIVVISDDSSELGNPKDWHHNNQDKQNQDGVRKSV